MNKSLEYVEVNYLFNTSSEEIEIPIHPELIIHSMINYCNGSIIAQLPPIRHGNICHIYLKLSTKNINKYTIFKH